MVGNTTSFAAYIGPEASYLTVKVCAVSRSHRFALAHRTLWRRRVC
jgi:hypothetical protein